MVDEADAVQLVTAQELLAEWLGDDVPTVATETIDRWLAKAERFVFFEVPSLRARLASGAEPHLLHTVKDVIAAVTTRILRNPDGKRSHQRMAGTFSETVTFAGDAPGALVLLDKEREMLRDPHEGRGKAFNVSMLAQATSPHLAWCTGMMGGNICSCGVDIAGRPIYEL